MEPKLGVYMRMTGGELKQLISFLILFIINQTGGYISL